MFPIPAMCLWSSSHDFSGAVRSAARSPISSGVSSLAERLDPEPGVEVGVELAGRQQVGVAEAARVREPHRAAVVEREQSPQVQLHVVLALVQARAADPLAADDQVAGHPQVHDERGAVVELAAGCTCRAGRRRRSCAPRPPPPAPRAGTGRLQRASRISSRSIRRPSTWGASWRQTVSTSGSSGTHLFYRSRAPHSLTNVPPTRPWRRTRDVRGLEAAQCGTAAVPLRARGCASK